MGNYCIIMEKNGVLTISNFEKGMADSAYAGFSNIANCEVFDTPGIVKITNNTTPRYTTTLTDLPIAYVEDSYGNNYMMTYDAKVYKNGVFIRDLGNIGWDLAIYGDYLIATSSSGGVGQLNAYGPLNSAGATFFTGIGSALDGSYYLKMTSFKNSTIYITNGTSIAWLSSLPTAAVAVAPTPTINTSLIQLPSGEAGTTISAIGTYMIIGTQASNGSWFNGTNGTIANLYLFDGIGVDNSVNSLVGSLNEASIQSMISYGNKMYVMAGIRGNLYVTNTASFTKIKRIPWNQNKLFGATVRIYPNAMSININGNILIGTSTLGSAYGSDPSPVQHGVYEVNTTISGYPTVFKQQISTGNVGQTQPLYIGFVFAGNGITYIGWQDGSTYGFDTTDFRLYTSNKATLETQLFYIASRLQRKTFQNIEFKLGKPLTTGQEITISYRKNLTDSYTLLKTYTYTNLGAVISHNDKATLDEIELLQIKIQLTQPITATFGNNIELMNITIW